MFQSGDDFRIRRELFAMIFGIFSIFNSISANNFDFDSLSFQIDKIYSIDDEQLNLILAEGKEYIEIENYEEALDKFQQYLMISEKFEMPKNVQIAYHQIGLTCRKLSNFDLSLTYLNKALSVENSQLTDKDKADILSMISSNYFNLGSYDESYNHKLQSIKIFENIGDSIGLGGDYYDLGSLFYYQKAYDQALDFYKQAYEIAKQINDQRLIYNCLGGMGTTYEELDDLEESIKLNKASLDLADSIGYLGGRSYSLHNLASNFQTVKDFDTAINYYQQSLEIKTQLDDSWGQCGTMIAIANIYSEQNKFKKAFDTYQAAFELANKINSNIRKSEIFLHLAEMYKKARQPEKAYKYLSDHLDLKDTIMNENTLKEMGRRKSQFEIQKREHEISLLKKDKELWEKEKEIQKLNQSKWLGVLAILVGLAGFFYFRFIEQKKVGKLLLEKNKEIEDKNLKISSQNKELESSNEDLKNFAYVASHDLREPLRMIKSFGDLLTKKYKSKLDERGQEFLHFITDAAIRMDTLLVDLLDYSRVNTNNQKPQQVSTEKTWLSVQTTMMPSFVEKNVDFHFETNDMPVVLGYPSQLYQLFQNLVSNAIKYQKNNSPKVKVSCLKNGKNYIFSVKDNGIGIKKEDQKRIFDMFSRLHSKDEFEGTGIGLATCKKIVNRHGGDIWVESEVGKGSTFFFTIPIPKLVEPNPEMQQKMEKTVLGIRSN